MFDLSGHVAVITGGNRGIGLGYATGLVKAGASVSIWSRSRARNEDAVAALEALGGTAHSVVCDVADEDSVMAATAETLDVYGAIDSLFANAGTTGGIDFPNVDVSVWSDVMDVNVTGTMLPVREVTRHMIARGEGGSIVVTSSIGAHHGLPVAPHYSASKAAQLGLVKALAVKLAKHAIRVNAICPGWVSTEMTTAQQSHDGFQEGLRARVPLKRWGTPEDFEGIAVFLASPASSFVTGTEMIVDGGYSAS